VWLVQSLNWNPFQEKLRGLTQSHEQLIYSFIYQDSWGQFVKSLTLIINSVYFKTLLITDSTNISLSTAPQSCLVFQFCSPPDTHAGPKPSDSSNPAWLLMEHLPSYKTGAHCEQWPHVQLYKIRPVQILPTIHPTDRYLPLWHFNLCRSSSLYFVQILITL